MPPHHHTASPRHGAPPQTSPDSTTPRGPTQADPALLLMPTTAPHPGVASAAGLHDGRGPTLTPTLPSHLLACSSSVPPSSYMSLAALSMRGWRHESETAFARAAQALSAAAPDGDAGGAPDLDGGGTVARRRRLRGALQQVLLLLDEDDGIEADPSAGGGCGGPSDDVGHRDAYPREGWAPRQ